MTSSSSLVNQNNIRNVCILAHVDHGKSSYADSLLAANNIISSRLAGKLRYLDSRLDEQERGITMKSSAVSLSYKTMKKATDGSDQFEDFRINLIDTPGHIDFTSEVSTASRLCDGALVLVDVVEGVCTQTISVLRQAWNEKLKPILVINKIDRLITELRLSPTEAYYHLVRLVEQVNAIVGSFFFADKMDSDFKRQEAFEQSEVQSADAIEEDFKESDDVDIYFNPANGDVLFSSAIDNWSFTISKFSSIWAKKLGIKEEKLKRCLWGDFFFDPKSKMVLTKKQATDKRGLKPMFVQFILDNLWAVYDCVLLNPDPVKTEKVIKSLELKVRQQELKSKDTKNLLMSICSQWLPISTTTFRAIVSKIPDPITSQSTRLPKMLYPEILDATQATPRNSLECDLFKGSSDESSHTVIYVSKMFAVPTIELPHLQRKQLTAEEMRELGRIARNRTVQESIASEIKSDSVVMKPTVENLFTNCTDSALSNNSVQDQTTEKLVIDQKEPDTNLESQVGEADVGKSMQESESLIGFARIYCGTVKVGQSLYCVLPKYNTRDPPEVRMAHVQLIKIKNLYMIMGRSLTEVNEVNAGHVFGIGGLGGKVLRNATLCGHPSLEGEKMCEATGEDIQSKIKSFDFVNLAGVQHGSAPIVRVSLEPKQPSEMPKLVEGLRLLNQSDPCVETFIQDTGEHVILTAGELHLERCLRDLRERFAKIQIQASKPIVPFRETAVRGVDMPPPKTKDHPRGFVPGNISDGLITFAIRATPLQDSITDYLLKNTKVMKTISSRSEQKARLSVNLTPDPNNNEPLGVQDDENDPLLISEDQDEAFWCGLQEICQKAHRRGGEELIDCVKSVWAFGPRRSGPNLLLDRSNGSTSLLSCPAVENPQALNEDKRNPDPPNRDSLAIEIGEFDDMIETAFQLATFKGPLCAEPVQGMCFSIEDFKLDVTKFGVESIRSRWSQITGELISALQEAFKSAMLDWSPRLMLAMYTCEIQATTEVLGKVYGVISRRRGVIKSEEIKDGTTFYSIRARIPIIESFGFNDELMKKTSGIALPQLIFDGFERIEIDPFWIPKTEEELEDFGDKADKENLAKKYMERVRNRKGMFVEKKIVQHAEKQRTLKR
ncbi:hypothetical protein PPACK8108_LOCUS1310 [Phakopsora pachyrhizi]|uniref:Ribosome assembly protein 1 n=1 Tax=Phakopsora pachyrhizi TaxID=170000 RepID=A0AAV0AGW5_PHAPC|nr:hypothetical protein PPACK8108_LOCUS1310 [Phakopsora pachyrhizi]